MYACDEEKTAASIEGGAVPPPPAARTRATRIFDEVRVYAGIAERTGVQLELSTVRKSAGYCNNIAALARKVRGVGDGTFYLPVDAWPPDQDRIELHKSWVVMS